MRIFLDAMRHMRYNLTLALIFQGRNNAMNQNGRLAALMARKVQIESQLHAETTALAPDTLRLTTLKRRKLQVKQEIERLAHAS